MPSLAFLDSKPVTPQERKEAKRVGEFMKIVRPSDEVVGAVVLGGVVLHEETAVYSLYVLLSVASCRKEIQIG